MKSEIAGQWDKVAFGILFICATVVGFLYHAHNWAAFCDLFRVHIDTHLYYHPLVSWGKSLSDTIDLPTRYALFQMPKGYLFLNLFLSKILPLLVLIKVLPVAVSLISIFFLYRLMRCYGDVLVAFFASLVFCLHSWTFHVYQALCPRAFFYPLLLSFLYYFQKKRYYICGAIYCAQCLLYPPAAVISLGAILIMRAGAFLYSHRGWREFGRIILLCLAGVLVGVLLYYAQFSKLEEKEFGPVISYTQMRSFPEFQAGGKESFFYKGNEWRQWLRSKRAGIGLNHPLAVLTVLSVVMWVMTWRQKNRDGVPLMFKAVTLSSVVLFLIAYGCLFTLYYPSRYLMFTLPLVIAAWFGCGVSSVFKAYIFPKRSAVFVVLFFCVIMACYGAYLIDSRIDTQRGGLINYGYLKNVITFLRDSKSNGCVAAPPYISDPVPLYTGKRVLFSDRLLIPFQVGYYGVMKKRLTDFYAAYYATSKDTVKKFCQQYNVDYLVIDLTDFQSDKTMGFTKDRGSYAIYFPLVRDFTSCVLPAVTGEARVYADGQFIIIDGNKL